MKTLYLIQSGEVSVADDFDANLAIQCDSVYALVETADEALVLASEYDFCRIQPDNAAWNGQTIIALQD